MVQMNVVSLGCIQACCFSALLIGQAAHGQQFAVPDLLPILAPAPDTPAFHSVSGPLPSTYDDPALAAVTLVLQHPADCPMLSVRDRAALDELRLRHIEAVHEVFRKLRQAKASDRDVLESILGSGGLSTFSEDQQRALSDHATAIESLQAKFVEKVCAVIPSSSARSQIAETYLRRHAIPSFGSGYLSALLIHRKIPFSPTFELNESQSASIQRELDDFENESPKVLALEFTHELRQSLSVLPVTKQTAILTMLSLEPGELKFSLSSSIASTPASATQWLRWIQQVRNPDRVRQFLMSDLGTRFAPLDAEWDAFMAKALTQRASVSRTDLSAEVIGEAVQMQVQHLMSLPEEDRNVALKRFSRAVLQQGTVQTILHHPVIRKYLELSESELSSLDQALAAGDSKLRKDWSEYVVRGGLSKLHGELPPETTSNVERLIKDIKDIKVVTYLSDDKDTK